MKVLLGSSVVDLPPAWWLDGNGNKNLQRTCGWEARVWVWTVKNTEMRSTGKAQGFQCHKAYKYSQRSKCTYLLLQDDLDFTSA